MLRLLLKNSFYVSENVHFICEESGPLIITFFF